MPDPQSCHFATQHAMVRPEEMLGSNLIPGRHPPQVTLPELGGGCDSGPLKRRILGRTGMSVSEFALGAMMVGTGATPARTSRPVRLPQVHQPGDARRAGGRQRRPDFRWNEHSSATTAGPKWSRSPPPARQRSQPAPPPANRYSSRSSAASTRDTWHTSTLCLTPLKPAS